jgi:hypothetical protein
LHLYKFNCATGATHAHDDGVRRQSAVGPEGLELCQGDAACVFVSSKNIQECLQVLLEPGQGARIKACQSLRKNSCRRSGSFAHKGSAGGRDAQCNGSTIFSGSGRKHEFLANKRFDEIAGRRLVDVHGSRQFTDADVREFLHYAQSPHLCAANPHFGFHLAKMRLHCIEYHAKAPQHAHGLVRGLGQLGLGCCAFGPGGLWFDGHGRS